MHNQEPLAVTDQHFSRASQRGATIALSVSSEAITRGPARVYDGASGPVQFDPVISLAISFSLQLT